MPVATINAGIQDFRLTLTSGLPVTTADVVGTGTIYFTPYKGPRIALHDGVDDWNVISSVEKSYVLNGLDNTKCYDLFAYNNAGVLALEALVWTSATVRATALISVDGILCKTGDTTRRYVGSFKPTAAATTEDSIAKRFLFNVDNQVRRPMASVRETVASWNYTTDTYREANGSTTNRLQFVLGQSQNIIADVIATAKGSGVAFNVGIGVDSTTVNSAIASNFSDLTSNVGITAAYRGAPGVGFHFLSWLEISTVFGTTTWIGDGAVPTRYQSRIYGEVFA